MAIVLAGYLGYALLAIISVLKKMNDRHGTIVGALINSAEIHRKTNDTLKDMSGIQRDAIDTLKVMADFHAVTIDTLKDIVTAVEPPPSEKARKSKRTT